MAETAIICVRSQTQEELSRPEAIKHTTKKGPHGHVQEARNFISSSGRPCRTHAVRNRHEAIPIENQAICAP